MKKLLLLMLLSICASRVAAQDASNPLGGDIRASSTNCSVSSSCVWQKLPANATSLTVTVANGPVGSFTGTLQFEQSSNGGFNFSAASPASTTAPGVFTFTVTTFTDFRVRASAFASGDAAVNMQASGPATGPPGPAGPSGGSSVSPNSPSPINFYDPNNYSGGIAVNDAKKTITAVTANLSSTITDATNSPWLSTDVGKKIYCVAQGAGNGTNALSVAIATISAFNSASSISIAPATGSASGQSGSYCVWFSNKAKAAFLAAGTAAQSALTHKSGNVGPTLSYPSAVSCPPGGYVVDGPFFNQVAASGTLGVSVIGAGRSSCTIYISPDVAASNNSFILNATQTTGQTFSGFTVDCSGAAIGLAVAPGFRFNGLGSYVLRDIGVLACANTSDNNGLFQFLSPNNLIVDGVSIDNSAITATNEPPFVITAGSAVHIRNWFTTNPGATSHQITQSGGQAFAGGPRTNGGGSIVIEDSLFDEGANPGPLNIQNGSSVSVIGTGFFSGLAGGITVDGTSSLYIVNSNIVPFAGSCGGGNRTALQLSTGSAVYAAGTSFQGCGASGAGASAAVNGPVGATFVDMGGNDFRNCPGGPPCALVTPANYGTLGFFGGVVPKATVTHTPNTCYAVAGNLLATAQNICTFLNDQNYQVLNITAQSGGTTPANSACATPPVITLSDGTRTATLTMTTGKTQWSSAVDASTVNSIFASGTTLTISIGANTCATPPVNVAVSYVLQSVLNP